MTAAASIRGKTQWGISRVWDLVGESFFDFVGGHQLMRSRVLSGSGCLGEKKIRDVCCLGAADWQLLRRIREAGLTPQNFHSTSGKSPASMGGDVCFLSAKLFCIVFFNVRW